MKISPISDRVLIRMDDTPTMQGAIDSLNELRAREDASQPVACCPRCRSTQLSADKQGFGLGKAAVGGLLLGPLGLLGGAIGSNKVKITCMSCGHVFAPGQGGR